MQGAERGTHHLRASVLTALCVELVCSLMCMCKGACISIAMLLDMSACSQIFMRTQACTHAGTRVRMNTHVHVSACTQ